MKTSTRLFLASTFLFSITGCTTKKIENTVPEHGKLATDYQQEMRTFIQDISAWSHLQKPGFLIVPQDGLSLLEATGTTRATYLQAINGVAQEEVYYGEDNNDDVETNTKVRDRYIRLANIARTNGKKVLVTDYCTSPDKITNSYNSNFANGFISYAATTRELEVISTTTPYNVNTGNITSLDSAKNFLYLINTNKFKNKSAYLTALQQTNFDVLVIDYQYEDTSDILTAAEVASLKIKANGGQRIVLAYMCIGQAEEYRWYWKSSWKTNPPEWLEPNEDPKWDGNYNVRYWLKGWKDLIYGNSTSYTQQLLNAGFDGAYLDLYDYEYWEE